MGDYDNNRGTIESVKKYYGGLHSCKGRKISYLRRDKI